MLIRRVSKNNVLYCLGLIALSFLLLSPLLSTRTPDTNTEKLMIFQQKYRVLSEQQQNGSADGGKSSLPFNLDQNTFLLVVVIGSIVFLVVSLICCVICIVRCIIRIERARSGGTKITNIRVNYQALCPKIEYSLFLEFVGQPYQEHCVICLQDFSPPTSSVKQPPLDLQFENENYPNEIVYPMSDEIKMEDEEPHQKEQSKPTEYVENEVPTVEDNLVKFTVCGHLLHAKCFDSWLQKQQNCPLCRQPFTVPNLQEWHKKLGVDIMNFDACLRDSQQNQGPHPRMGESSKKSHYSNIHETLNSINKSIEQNNFQTRLEIEQRRMQSLTKLQKAILTMYCKIMAYHQKKAPNLTKIEKLQSRPEGGRGLYFEQSNESNHRSEQYETQVQVPYQDATIKLKKRGKLREQSEGAMIQ